MQPIIVFTLFVAWIYTVVHIIRENRETREFYKAEPEWCCYFAENGRRN